QVTVQPFRNSLPERRIQNQSMKQVLFHNSWPQQVISRRKFLVGAVALASALTLASAFPFESTEFLPGFIPLSNMIALDFVSASSSPGQIHYNYLSAFDEA